MSVRAVRAAAVFITMLLLCGSLSAQKQDSTRRTVEGRVTNAANEPVADAVVQFENTKTLQIRIVHHSSRRQLPLRGTSKRRRVQAETRP